MSETDGPMDKIQKHTEVIVVKVGGRFFDELLESKKKACEHQSHPLLEAMKALQNRGKKLVLVHGGGDQVQRQLKALNMHSEKLNGLRVTPFSHMPIVAGVLSGYLNKTLVAHSIAFGMPAVGITLADGGISLCQPLDAALGAVGKPEAKSNALLSAILNANMLPVVASIGCDEHAKLYNVNADHAATCIAQLLNAQLLLLSDVSGVLDKDKTKLTTLSAKQADEMIAQGHITDGMIVKVKAAQESADLLASPVTIGSWNELSVLAESVADSGETSFGTQIYPRV